MKEYNMAAVMKIREKIKKTDQGIEYHETMQRNRDSYADSVISWSDETLAELRKERGSLEKEYKEKLTALQTALDTVQKWSRVRTISTWVIIESLETIEKRLGISKKAMEGIKVRVDANAQNFPGAYRGRPESTWFSAEYRKGSWRITSIGRNDTARAGNGCNIFLTDGAREALLTKYEHF